MGIAMHKSLTAKGEKGDCVCLRVSAVPRCSAATDVRHVLLMINQAYFDLIVFKVEHILPLTIEAPCRRAKALF